MSSLVSKFTVSAIGIASKALLSLGYCRSVTVNGIHHLHDALQSEERENGRGIITMANHISTLDDPVVWGILPAKYYWNTRTTRWVLGASDIMFTNPVFSVFFRHGQVLETFRGDGVFQPAIDRAIEKLNKGDWIHLFGEGKVNQPERLEHQKGESTIPVSQHHANLLRFKWGVGRIVMEAKKPPLILPMWLTGFDELMPEGRSFPFKYFPKRGVALGITFGEPIRNADIKHALQLAVASPPSNQGLSSEHTVFDDSIEQRSGIVTEQGWMGDGPTSVVRSQDLHHNAVEVERIRSTVTAVIQREVENLGKRVAEGIGRLS